MSGELSTALKAIEQRHSQFHWHCWHSDKGRLWATSPHCENSGGSGTTVDASGCEGLERAIAEVEHGWEQSAGWAA